MIIRRLLPLAGLAAVTACQTAPATDSGFLSAYDRLQTREDTVRASIREHRDEAGAAGVEQVWLEPAVLVGGAGADLPEAEALCRHFAARWRNVALVRAIYDAIKLGNPISGLLDRLTRRLGKAEAALVMSYMKLLYILENGPSRER